MVSHPWVFVVIAIAIIVLLSLFPRDKAEDRSHEKPEKHG